MYKHFVGVKNSNDLKAKYRELAKKFHPDRGGNQVVFVEMSAEYNRILDHNVSFPISNTDTSKTPNYADEFVENMRKYAYAQSAAARDQANIWDEIKKKRPLTEDEIWKQAKEADENIAIVDDLVDIVLKERKTGNWFLAEMIKLDGLGLKHFKFAKYAFKKRVGQTLTDDWVSTCYRNYVAIQSIKYDVE